MARKRETTPILTGEQVWPEITSDTIDDFMTSVGMERDIYSRAAEAYNRRNPDVEPITGRDILEKDRSGFLGGLRLLVEGIVDALTDQLPEDIARVWRGGDVSPDGDSWADKVIRRQQRDKDRRIPSKQEVEGDWFAKGLYGGPQSVPTSMVTGLAGMGMGAAAGAVAGPGGALLGGMVGAGTLTGAAFFRLAKDSFIDEVQQDAKDRLGRTLTTEEASLLNAAIDEDATEFGLWEAGPEAVSQFFTAGLLGGAGGAVLRKLGLGALAERVGQKAVTRVGAKVGAEIAEEEVTEGITYFGQEGLRKSHALRDDDPSLDEFIREQAFAVAVGAGLQMGGMAAGRHAWNRYQGRRRAEALRRELDADANRAGTDAANIAGTGGVDGANGADMREFEGILRMPEWDAPPLTNADADAGARLTEALDRGDTVDLLGGSDGGSDGSGGGSGGVAETRGAAMPDPAPAPLPTAPRTPEPSPIAPTEAEAQGTGMGAPAPVPPAMPTQSQLTETREAPRADTTAMAQGLGLPAPEVLPEGMPEAARQPERPVPQAPVVEQAVQPAPVVDQAVQPAPVPDGAALTEALRQEATPVQAAPAQGGGERAALISRLPAEMRARARRLPNSRLRELLASMEAEAAAREESAERALTEEDAGVSSAEISPELFPEQGATRPQTHEESGHEQRDDARDDGATRDGADTGHVAGDGGTVSERPSGHEAGAAGGSAGGSAGGHTGVEGARRRDVVKIPNRPDEAVGYDVVEADDVRASHLPERSFQRDPRYALENERRYHEEAASQRKVLENAASLDPAFLMEGVDANHGAPVVDREGNVLGGNGRAMSVRLAYEKFPERAAAYREALRGAARRLGLDPSRLDGMRRPVLVRRLERDLEREERQGLVSALNDTFTDSRESRASGKSRGDRLRRRTLEALAAGLAEAETLRQYFDESDSAGVVEMLIDDGVIRRTERNAFVGPDGLLNPDGKRVVEEALRGRVARSYEALAAVPGPVLAKIDAAIPHLLIAESVGASWNITGHMRDALDLLAEFRASGEKTPETFLNRMEMTTGKAASERYSQAAQALFLGMHTLGKAAYVRAFASYAGQAKISVEAGGMPGAGMSQKEAAKKFLGIGAEDGAKPATASAEDAPPRAEGNAATEEGGWDAPVARVPANAIRKSGVRSAIDAAIDWIREHVSGPARTKIGAVEVDANAVRDSLSHSLYQNKLDAVQAIVPVLEKGEYLGKLPDKDGKPIDNHYFAGKVVIGGNEKIVFVRTREAAGMPNRFYVHEVFTEEEIKKSESVRRVTSDADRPYKNASDFYRSLLAAHLKVKSGEKESSGENAATAEGKGSYGTVDAPDTVALAGHFADAFVAGKKFGTIVEARREAGALLGGAVRPATAAAKAVDEAVELAVTLAARRAVEGMRRDGASAVDIFRALVDLYRRQPRLNVRTSTSIAQQAYSTPVPIAFLASRLAGIDGKTRVFEPTAGNGMLLIEASPGKAVVNELNPDRSARLRSQGFEVTEHDAVNFAPERPVEAVIANPPFGRVRDGEGTKEFDVNGLRTKELDHAIAARALGALQEGGRAVLVIGGKQGQDAARARKYRAAEQVRFWGWLFDRYRVIDHFGIDGTLYERQGAGYPIDVVVLENSGTSGGRPFPGAALPRVYKTFDALEEVLHGQVVDAAEREPGVDGGTAGAVGERQHRDQGTSDGSGRQESAVADSGGGRTGRDAGLHGKESGKRLDTGLRDDQREEAGEGRRERTLVADAQHGDDVSSHQNSGGRKGSAVAAESHAGEAGQRRGRDDAGRLGERSDGGDVRSELGVESRKRQDKKKAAKKPKDTEFQVAYEPASGLGGMGTLVPRNMASAVRRALAALQDRHGDIDRYVAEQLGYPVEELGDYFAAEQVDALGMAISNIAEGSGFIIGDQTGIGKGRVNAAIIRWAKRQGLVPVFVTMKPELYADMVRDLGDIGMEGFNPLPTNADLTGGKAILLPDGRTLRTRSSKAHEKTLRDVQRDGLGAYDAIFTTYDQLNPVKGKDTFRRSFLMSMAPNAVFILDESHNAGGQASTRRKAGSADDRAQFVRKMLQASRQGAFYSSATYAKRPDVMSLYFKTDMRYAAEDMGKLAEAIERGGIPMQQAVAAALTETGQYLRRERSFEGAEMRTSTVPIDKTRAEKVAEIMRAIMAFDDAKTEAVKAADKKAARTGGSVGESNATGKGGASSTNFTAVMHNVIAQSLLAQKVDAVVEAAAEAVGRGEKAVIALANTMGSMIKEHAEKHGIAEGQPINFTFNDMFARYLEKSRTITVKRPGEDQGTPRQLTDEELGPEGVSAYGAALDVIRNSDFGGLQVSIIDRLLAAFESRGIRADEITGRTERIDYTTDTPTYARRTTGPSDRIRVVEAFNAGDLDVVILNQSGSTGISLHSSERFKDQKRRNMVIAQAESNIDVFMQTLGRVFRTGQVVPPAYQFVMSDLPAEKRPAAVLAKKMASLNANTTAARDSDTSFKNIPDFLNKCGDAVAAQVMADNPELSRMLGDPVDDGQEDAMRKVTGRIPLLPVREQERLYALLEAEYADYVAQLEAMGGSGLEARSLPLDARLLESQELVPARDAGKETPFAAAAMLGTYDVKKLGKPWPSAKVREMVAAAKEVDTDRLWEDALAWNAANAKARKLSAESASRQRERLRELYEVIAGAANLRPGTPVLVSGNNALREGVLLGLRRKGGADNPLALGAWKMDVALPDASRKVTVSLSQTVRGENRMTVTASHRDPGALYAMFDSGQLETREKAHIITGNILAAYQKIDGKGQVISFQDREGNTHSGILLPKDVDPRKLLETMDVSLSPEASVRFVRDLPGKAAVKTADKLLVLSSDGREYAVTVPGSKAKGAQFFLNGAVLEAAGKDFVRSGQSMVLRGLSEDRALGVLRALVSQGYGLVADNNREQARALAAEAPLASLASRHERGRVVVKSADLKVPEGAGLAEYIKAAKEFHDALKKESENGRPVINRSPGFAGKPIRFSGKGWRKNVNAGADRRKWQLFPALRAILENAEYVRTETTEGRADNFTKSHWFECDVELNGEKLRSGFSLLEDANGNLFYNLNADVSRSANKKAPRSLKPNAQSWGYGTLFRQDNYAPDEASIGDTDNDVNLHLLPQEPAGRFLPPSRKGARPSPAARTALRRVLETLDARAANGTRARLVDTVGELPARLREAFGDNAETLEGVYDPETGDVWLVAGNIESPQRAAEVWAHETLAHHGLRALLDAGERKRLLNQLWLRMGGMGHPLVAATARRYGLDPRTDAAARQTVMEETLARLAERRARGILSEAERSVWRRLVDAVLRAWRGLVRRLTGAEGRMDAGGMERLLDSLQGYVMDGRPAAGKRATANTGDAARAALDNGRKEAAHAAWRQLERDTKQWTRQVEDFDPSAFGDSGQRKLLDVCRTPEVLRKLGAPDVPMTMTAANLAKILSDKADHQLPRALVARLPGALAEPVMVFESATVSDAFVVLTDLTHEGRSVMAAVHVDVERQRLRVNDITSAYRRGSERWYLRQMEDGRLLYQDKKKSLAWARTNRLQLPKVRKLPAKLENRLLTEQDIVKPESPAGERPLASLRPASTDARERAAAVTRRLRGILGRGVSEDVEALLRDPDQGRLVPREDLSRLERLFKLPHWIAKDHPGFAAIYERQLRRVDERRAAVLDAVRRVPLLFDGDAKTRLNAGEERQLAAMIWKWDGKEIGPLKGIEKFQTKGVSLNGRKELELNPRYAAKFREWLDTQPEPERVKEAFAQVRGLLDAEFLKAYRRMAGMADMADTDLELFRTEMGNLPNYFPHRRSGKYYVQATTGAGTANDPKSVVFRQHFDVPAGSSVREEWAKIVQANRANHPGATWSNPREVTRLPDDVLGAPIDPQAMEQLITAAVRRQVRDADKADEVRKALLSGLSDVLKTRGFGAHAIQRKNIPGFERDDIKGILYDYVSGLNGWLAKMDASADFAKALGKIDAGASPDLWSYASQYVHDMLRNADGIDRMAGNIKTLAFAWYLGGNLKTAVVNSTQNLIVGVPRLQQEVSGGGALWLRAAMDSIGLRFSGKGISGAAVKRLTPDEMRMLEELYGAGVIADAHMDEIRGQIARSPALRAWERTVRLLGMPMSIVEHFNRASLALAAYRAARAGRLSATARRRLGVPEGRTLSHEEALAFADGLVRDAHFEYGKNNAPELLRGSAVGRMISPVFVFRSFGGNILNLWWRALRREGGEGRVFVAKSLAATIALGGLTSFPFFATLSALCTALSGDDEDWTTRLRRAMPENDMLRDVVCYGLPTLGGVSIGGSLRLETPFTEGLEKGTTFKEIMTDGLSGLIGIPYDLAVVKPSKALEAKKHGALDRAVEALAPTFVANIMAAYRLATEGQTSLRGRPINSPGETGARTLSGYEAVAKGMGFQPVSSAKSYAAWRADKLRASVRSDRIDGFVTRALDDLETQGRPHMMRELRRRLEAHNREMEAEGRPGLRITPKEVLRRVASRRRQNRATPEQRAKGAAQKALWGV